MTAAENTFCAKIVAPLFDSGVLFVQIACVDQAPTQQPVVSPENSDTNILLEFGDDDGAPIDITSATVLSISILEADGTTILTKSLKVQGAISLVDGLSGQ